MMEHGATDSGPNSGGTEPEAGRAEPPATDHDARAAIDAAAATERRAASQISPGARAMVVAAAVLVLVLSLALPHAGSANGWEVLAGSADATTESIALPSRIFTILAAAFGVVMSMLALVTRRWVIAWVALAGCALSSIFGMLAIWSRQTLAPESTAAGVGPGLVLGWVSAIFLTFHWLRVVWSRTIAQMDAEHERRRLAGAAEESGEDLTRLGAFRPRLK